MNKQSFYYLFFLALLGIVSPTVAQKPQASKGGYRIEVQVKGLKDTTCYLGNYFFTETSGKFYVQDTAKVDSEGRMVFEGDSTLQGGLYIVSVPKKGYFEFIMADQKFAMETDTSDLVGHLKVRGSRENEMFTAFRLYMGERYRKMYDLDKNRKGKDDKATDAAIKALQDDTEAYQTKFVKENPDLFAAKLVKGNQTVPLPDHLKVLKTHQDSLNAYYFYKDHYWDNIDLTDSRMMVTPYLGNRILNYMAMGGAEVDTLNAMADKLMARAAKAPKTMRKTLVYFITSRYETGDENKGRLMGTEGVFVHMGKKYYLGEPALWDTSTIRRFKERLSTLEPVLMGKQVKNLFPTDTLGNYITPLYDVKAKYTVLFIFDPNCGHCKEKAPKLIEWYGKSRFKNSTKVYALCGVQGEQALKDWKKFLKESLKGNQFINGYDGKYHIDFKNWLDVVVYPVMYLLDKDKKIIGRGIGVDDLDGVIDLNERAEKVQKDTKK